MTGQMTEVTGNEVAGEEVAREQTEANVAREQTEAKEVTVLQAQGSGILVPEKASETRVWERERGTLVLENASAAAVDSVQHLVRATAGIEEDSVEVEATAATDDQYIDK